MLKHFEISGKILRAFYDVYNELGHGFVESVYEQAFVIAVRDFGLQVQEQVPIPVFFRGHDVGEFRADLLVEGSLLIELKAAKCLDSKHTAQVINYLKATDIEIGMLLNFGPRPEFKRIILDRAAKDARAIPRETLARLGEVQC